MDEDIADGSFEAEIIQADLQDLCRICASTSDSPLISLYEGNGLAEELPSKIMLYLPIKISEEDILPLKACVNCANSVLTWHLLYECCLDADNRFKKMLSEEQLVEEDQQATETHEIDSAVQLVKENDVQIFEDDKVELERETDDILMLKAEFGPEDEQYLEDESDLNSDENESENDQQPIKHRIFKSRQQHQCNFCETSFKAKDLLTEHLKKDHYNLIFHCDICNEYKDQQDLISHMTAHALSSIQKPDQISKPKDSADQSANDKLKCKKCAKIFSSLSGLRYHMNSVHAKLKTFACEKCSKIFACKRILENHIKSMHTKEKLLQCDQCEKSFKTDSSLYSHKKTHVNVFPYECAECGKTFRFKHHHVAHLDIHAAVKNHTCNICNKKFFAQNNLSKHLKTHSATLDFACHICDTKMKQKRYLYEHMKRVHQRVLD